MRASVSIESQVQSDNTFERCDEGSEIWSWLDGWILYSIIK